MDRVYAIATEGRDGGTVVARVGAEEQIDMS